MTIPPRSITYPPCQVDLDKSKLKDKWLMAKLLMNIKAKINNNIVAPICDSDNISRSLKIPDPFISIAGIHTEMSAVAEMSAVESGVSQCPRTSGDNYIVN